MQNNETPKLEEEKEEKLVKRQSLFERNKTSLVDKQTLNKWAVCVFGECGQGKSTLLT